MNAILDKQSERGWLLPYLLWLDSAEVDGSGLDKKQRAKAGPLPFNGTRRWQYWVQVIESNLLSEEPIPYIDFMNRPLPEDEKHIIDMLNIARQKYFSWYDEAWLSLVKWLLHGFGRDGLEREIERIPDYLKEQWYIRFNLAHLLHSPCDWSAFVLQGGIRDDKATQSPWAKTTGFFSTPMEVVKMLAKVTIEDGNNADKRLLSVYDPCCGTGSMLLEASNYSLCLFGQDIVYDLCLCAELNGYLFMPWLVVMPGHTQKMLNDAYAMTFSVANVSAPVGIAIGSEDITKSMAMQRKESATSFWQAVHSGGIEQASLFGG